ncbi:copper resistance CopC family protein [Allonocardiopsis opalescens]|uniref:CopC domain-containing protein n=1 Tax=Allonocardiopsis opalescens TaxID=1144618 RepID=A0A2T0Q9N7_9ACTN|nr:copper resistance CopC family protein [Allonocardiopsis opalescens]PRY00555.1 hypothetical protein CLV72_102186 [Allonocardiopsis opalescens]
MSATLSDPLSGPRPLPRPARRAAALLAAGLAASAALLAGAPAALAHNQLTDSSPEDGASLDTAPEEIVLTFDLEVLEAGNNGVVVTGPGGERFEQGATEIDHNEVIRPVGGFTEPGDYEIGYRIVGADGHVVDGTLTFELTADAVAAAAPSAGASASGTPPAGGADTSPAAAADAAAVREESESSGGVSPVVWIVIGVIALVGVGAGVLWMRRGASAGG